jgi:hypothetical protein
MREAEFSSKSWHCQLAHFGGLPEHREETDICAYTRAIAKGIVGGAFVIAVLLTLGGGILWVLGDFAGWVACLLIVGWVRPDTAAFCAAAVLCVGTVVGLLYLLYKTTKVAAHAAQDTFIGDAIDSVKHRMCFRVRIR